MNLVRNGLADRMRLQMLKHRKQTPHVHRFSFLQKKKYIYQTLFISTQKLFRLKPNGILEGFDRKSTTHKKKYKDDFFFYLVLFLFSPNLTISVRNDSLSNHTLYHNPKGL